MPEGLRTNARERQSEDQNKGLKDWTSRPKSGLPTAQIRAEESWRPKHAPKTTGETKIHTLLNTKFHMQVGQFWEHRNQTSVPGFDPLTFWLPPVHCTTARTGGTTTCVLHTVPGATATVSSNQYVLKICGAVAVPTQPSPVPTRLRHNTKHSFKRESHELKPGGSPPTQEYVFCTPSSSKQPVQNVFSNRENHAIYTDIDFKIAWE